MKRSKPIDSSRASSPRRVRSVDDLRRLQRAVGGAIMKTMAGGDMMDRASRPVAETFIKPNNRLTSFERLEIYNRSYWFRLIDCFYEDYPGLRAVLGEWKFDKLCRAYLAKYPSTSFTLRNLGQSLERFLKEEAKWTASRHAMALDMARLEWAHIVAFDGEAKPVVNADELLDSKPERLRLGLQPYVTLLELRYPLDEFLIAVKRRHMDALRSEASNTVTELHLKRRREVALPKAAKIFVAVHRADNSVYYKRLTREQFELLRALQRGVTLAKACACVSEANPDEIQRWFATWMSFGWFCRR